MVLVGGKKKEKRLPFLAHRRVARGARAGPFFGYKIRLSIIIVTIFLDAIRFSNHRHWRVTLPRDSPDQVSEARGH